MDSLRRPAPHLADGRGRGARLVGERDGVQIQPEMCVTHRPHEREGLGGRLDERGRLPREGLEADDDAARGRIGHDVGEEVPGAREGIGRALAGQQAARRRGAEHHDVAAQRAAEVHEPHEVLARGPAHGGLRVVDVQPLGAREQPVQPEHPKPHGLGRLPHLGRHLERPGEDGVAEGVRGDLDGVVAGLAQGPETLDDGPGLVQLVAAAEAADHARAPVRRPYRRSPRSLWTTWAMIVAPPFSEAPDNHPESPGGEQDAGRVAHEPAQRNEFLHEDKGRDGRDPEEVHDAGGLY